jgi:hypothetical protein
MLWASAMAGYTENGNREAKQRKSCGFTPELGHMRTQTPQRIVFPFLLEIFLLFLRKKTLI